MRLGISTSLTRPVIRHGSALPHVADANARLSLDPTGKVAGYQIVQDDNSTTYTFNGDGADADAGLWVTGAGTSEWNDSYTLGEGGKYYSVNHDPAGFKVQGGPTWVMGNDYTIHVDSDYPWQSSWDFNGGANPLPTVARNPIASLTNWTP